MGKEKKRLGVVLFLTLEICIFGLKGSKSAIVSSPAAKRGSCVPVFRTQLSVKKKKKKKAASPRCTRSSARNNAWRSRDGNGARAQR